MTMVKLAKIKLTMVKLTIMMFPFMVFTMMMFTIMTFTIHHDKVHLELVHPPTDRRGGQKETLGSFQIVFHQSVCLRVPVLVRLKYYLVPRYMQYERRVL